MCDPAGAHITRIYVTCPRQSPSPIRSSNTVPVCTSTPIINVGLPNPSQKQQMALLAKEILKSHRSTDTSFQKPESPKQPTTAFLTPQNSSDTFIQKSESPKQDKYAFISKETGQPIDFTTGDGIGKMPNLNTGTVTKKKKTRQSLAVVPPPQSARSSKSSDEGDYLVPMNTEIPPVNEKKKTSFTSYDGVQMFTFTLDDD